MNKIIIEKQNVAEYICDLLSSSKFALTNVANAKFHHNTSYGNAPSVCKYGILSLIDLNKLGLRNDSNKMLEKMNDIESHINGNNGISLSVVGLQDLYNNEYEYDPSNPRLVDFLVSSDIHAYRNSSHYGNEYICTDKIGVNHIASLDIRIFEYISILDGRMLPIDNLIDMYNKLVEVSKIIQSQKIDLPVREMSNNTNFSIDVDKLSTAKMLMLK